MSILKGLDRAAVSAAARLETRNREVVLPPVSIYRWWARRTVAVNEAILKTAEGAFVRTDGVLSVLDPFSGGGVIPLVSLARGHTVYAQDLNPWAARGLKAILALPSPEALAATLSAIEPELERIAAKAYGTTLADGSPGFVVHTFRVAVSACGACGERHRLFPFATVTLLKRRDRRGRKAYLACSQGHLFEGDLDAHNVCDQCAEVIDLERRYLPARMVCCPSCGASESLSSRCDREPLSWEVVLVERSDGRQREFGTPTPEELAKAAEPAWRPRRKLGAVRDGVETRVLRRHGFTNWEALYPSRQRWVTEALLRLAAKQGAAREALEMAVLGTVEMAGHVSRWDRYYLKAFESMASHRYNLTTFSVEPNVVGTGAVGRGTLLQRLRSFTKASRWLLDQDIKADRATVICGNSERIKLADATVDLVLTDPPYHDDVQYGDLSLPFRVWCGLSDRKLSREAVAIPHAQTLAAHRRYRHILRKVFAEMKRVLKADGRLVFSYANREPAAWVNLFAALRSAGFHPVSYAILQSENEMDPLRRKGRACSFDLLLELSPCPCDIASPSRLTAIAGAHADEMSYLDAVGEAFLMMSAATNGWEDHLLTLLRSHAFIKPPLDAATVSKHPLDAEFAAGEPAAA